MNKQQLLQMATSEPRCQDQEYLDALASDATLAATQSQAIKNDQTLGEFLQRATPTMSAAGLDKLLAISEQPVKISSQLPKNAYLAIAASLIIALFSLSIFNTQDEYNNSLVAHALSHTAHGEQTAQISHTSPTLDSLNGQLVDFGLQLANAEHVVWFQDCDFEGIRSAHLIYQVANTKYHVYLVPKTLQFEQVNEIFSNEQYRGSIEELANGYMVIVAPIKDNIGAFKDIIKEQVQWRI